MPNRLTVAWIGVVGSFVGAIGVVVAAWIASESIEQVIDTIGPSAYRHAAQVWYHYQEPRENVGNVGYLGVKGSPTVSHKPGEYRLVIEFAKEFPDGRYVTFVQASDGRDIIVEQNPSQAILNWSDSELADPTQTGNPPPEFFVNFIAFGVHD
jgi:hypothetical protein